MKLIILKIIDVVDIKDQPICGFLVTIFDASTKIRTRLALVSCWHNRASGIILTSASGLSLRI